MYVIKRNGQSENISFDKVLYRIKSLCALPEDRHLLLHSNSKKYRSNESFTSLNMVDYNLIARETIKGLYDHVSTKKLDKLSASIAIPMAFEHPEYGILASRILISNFHKNNIHYIKNHYHNLYKIDLNEIDIEKNLLLHTAGMLYNNIDTNNNQSPLLSPDIYQIINNNSNKLEALIDYNYDYKTDYAGFQMLTETYLQKCSFKIKDKIKRICVERLQHLLMRVSLGIHCSKYQDYNKLRQNDNAIFSENIEIFRKYLNPKSFYNLQKEVEQNQTSWENYIQIIRDNTICYSESSDAEIIEKSVKKYSLSWDELLMKFDGNITNEQFEEVKETYLFMRDKYFIHATPTLFSAGTLKPQLSSCFLIQLPYDSLDSIADYWKSCALISKSAGGIGSHAHGIRSKDSYIRGTNGKSDGITPLIRVVDSISTYINQGGQKRPGSHVIYVEFHHGDIFETLNLKKPRGNDAERARNLFYAIWMNDEFMRCLHYEVKLEKNIRSQYLHKYTNLTTEHEKEIAEKIKLWYLMDPNISKNLSNLYDEGFSTEYIFDDQLFDLNLDYYKKYKFTYQYRKYIQEKKYVKKVSAGDLWRHVCDLLMETGIPYLMFKDACNRKSNQKNLGTIKSSNLCTEIVEFSSPEEIAVCNLASINQTSFIVDEKPEPNNYAKKFTEYFEVALLKLLGQNNISKKKYIDYNLYEKILRRQVKNLNKIIDGEFYPLKEAKYSNLKHRPIAVGSQDFANLLTLLRIPFDSDLAQELNFYLYEFMYFICCDESCKLAEKDGYYESFPGSPASQGLLQFDLWIKEQGESAIKYPLSLPWNELKIDIKKYGMRNSLLVALMPTGSTSTIMGCSPCFEPHNALVYKRKNKLGEFVIVNRYLINDLIELGLWNKNIKNELLLSEVGGIGNITKIPKLVRDIYKICWDISSKITTNMCLGRSPFIDQSQSYSVFMKKPTVASLTQFHYYGWKKGIKTSSYYTRRLAVADASKTQADRTMKEEENTVKEEKFEENTELCIFKPGCKSCE